MWRVMAEDLYVCDYFQVITGGKNKYLINGSNVQNNRVKDLFCSVQLNVNNPHFLIMQGRITKVLNMKPPEVNTYFWLCFFVGVVLHLPQHRLFACDLNFCFSFVVLQMVVQLHNFIHFFTVDICWIFSLCTDVTFYISTDLYMQTLFFFIH